MITKLKDEAQLTDKTFRAEVIQEIIGTENVARKLEQLKRTEIYRDQSKKYVMERFRRQKLKEETLVQMENRATNVSILKKIINKLARVYVGGVNRTPENASDQERIDAIAKELELNQAMKKLDRYRELHKNALIMILPIREWMEKTYDLKPKVFAPWQYDVIEDQEDNEQARVVILTEFVERNQLISVGQERSQQGDGRDQIIADREEDKGEDGERRFIWWSKKYHFTTDENGDVIADKSPEGGINPIGMIPGAFVNDDQDGSFWAQGGSDLVDAALLVNIILTDMHSIMYQQGYGQLVVTGRDIPKEVEVGPHTAIILEQQHKDDPAPSANFISAAPPVGEWMQAVEQTVALLLTTNNLSTSTVSAKLGASDFASGIALMIDQSEAMGEIEDVKTEMASAEHEIWEVIKAWMDLYLGNKLLCDDLKAIGPIDSSEITIKFGDARPMMSEKEKIEILKARKDLGLNTEIELLKLDNPDLTEAEAQKKLLQLSMEKLERMATFTQQMQQGDQNGQSKENGAQGESQGEEEVNPLEDQGANV